MVCLSPRALVLMEGERLEGAVVFWNECVVGKGLNVRCFKVVSFTVESSVWGTPAVVRLSLKIDGVVFSVWSGAFLLVEEALKE